MDIRLTTVTSDAGHVYLRRELDGQVLDVMFIPADEWAAFIDELAGILNAGPASVPACCENGQDKCAQHGEGDATGVEPADWFPFYTVDSV